MTAEPPPAAWTRGGYASSRPASKLAAPPRGPAPGEPQPMTSRRKHRILWNTRDDDIDEVVFDHPKLVHIEQQDDRCWWIGVSLPGGGYWSGNFHCDSRGHMTFTEQEGWNFDWDADHAHQEQP
jgi:hypothetical protein